MALSLTTALYLYISVSFNVLINNLGVEEYLSPAQFSLADNIDKSTFNMENCLLKGESELCRNYPSFIEKLRTGLTPEWYRNRTRYESIETGLGFLTPFSMKVEQILLHGEIQKPISIALRELDGHSSEPLSNPIYPQKAIRFSLSVLSKYITSYLIFTSAIMLLLWWFSGYIKVNGKPYFTYNVNTLKRTYKKILFFTFLMSVFIAEMVGFHLYNLVKDTISHL
jgi:hypothetical protein